MANDKPGVQYGEATQEQHRASGYRLPETHYKVPESATIDMSTTKPDGVHTEAGKKGKPAPAENKSRAPVIETKSAAKTTRKRR